MDPCGFTPTHPASSRVTGALPAPPKPQPSLCLPALLTHSLGSCREGPLVTAPRGMLKLHPKEGEKTGLGFPALYLKHEMLHIFSTAPHSSAVPWLLGCDLHGAAAAGAGTLELLCLVWAQGGQWVAPGSPAPWQAASGSHLHLRTLPSNFIHLLVGFLYLKNCGTYFQLVLIDIIPVMLLLGQQFPLMNIQHCISASSQMW